MINQSTLRSVIITGDLTMDWHIVNQVQGKQAVIGWNPSLCTRASLQRGGCALLADLVKAIAREESASAHQYTICKPEILLEDIHPTDRRFHHSYALWSQVREGSSRVWRVEQFLGLDSCQAYDPKLLNNSPQNTSAESTIVIIDDANLGFRDQPSLWPQEIAADAEPTWILLKMARPVAEGKLWQHLRENHAERLITIIPVEDLRHTEVHISRGLSWERTAQDVAWELVHNPCVNGLSTCAHVIVSFDTAGAIVLSQIKSSDQEVPPETSLFFDPDVIEGMWKQAHPGLMIGYTTCLAASIARQLMLSPEKPDISRGVQAGLRAIRSLHTQGYAMLPGEPEQLAFPTERILTELASEQEDFAQVGVQNPVFSYNNAQNAQDADRLKGWWTILEDQYRENLAWIAEQIVLKGTEIALEKVPQGKFGHLLTVDRQEIESFRSIHNLTSEYLSKDHQKKPLSIAVFGAPGSGKSFGITQVAESLAPGRLEVLEFNLSQFAGPHEIIDALHRVRDVILSGRIPLVFWDEFDSALNGKPLGWLRYFLAPMQDGAFREGQIIHPIGRSIFVFAGGTSHTMAGFGEGLTPEDYRAAKVPDFISRLKGFVDILGPNPPETNQTQSETDPYYIIRRAILVRSLLERNAPQLFEKQGKVKALNIDRGVLQAFLNISRYKHGIRSIESLITTSSLSGKQAFERSCLPPKDQLDLYVDAQEFLSLVQQLKLEGDLLEKLAQAYHQIYRRKLKDLSQAGGDEQRETSAEITWSDLPEDEKEQNRAAVRDIPNKLAQIGFIMIPSRSNQPIFKFPDNDEDLEKLAQFEHERWANSKIKAGWTYGPKTIKQDKVHQSLVSWDKLSPEDQEKDIAFVRGIPSILAEAGYTMVKLHQPEPKV